MNDPSTYTKEEQIAGLIEQINAYIEQYHSGSVELVAIEEDLVKVRVGGACEGCPLLPAHSAGLGCRDHTPIFPGCPSSSCRIKRESLGLIYSSF